MDCLPFSSPLLSPCFQPFPLPAQAFSTPVQAAQPVSQEMRMQPPNGLHYTGQLGGTHWDTLGHFGALTTVDHNGPPDGSNQRPRTGDIPPSRVEMTLFHSVPVGCDAHYTRTLLLPPQSVMVDEEACMHPPTATSLASCISHPQRSSIIQGQGTGQQEQG